MQNENSSPSKRPQRILVEQESRASIPISTPAFLSLARRAGRNNVPLTILEQVYCRGLLASIPSSKNTPEQQAFNRVDSFIHEGKAYELDYDLVVETPKVPDGKKHMGIIKNAIKNFQDKTEQPIDGEQVSESALGGMVYRGVFKALTGSRRRGKSHTRSKSPVSDDEYVAARKHRMELNQRAKDEFKSEYTQKKVENSAREMAHARQYRLSSTTTPLRKYQDSVSKGFEDSPEGKKWRAMRKARGLE